MSLNNFIFKTDSYKLGHWSQYPEGTEGVYSYLEARKGAEFDHTVFVGLEPILKSIAGIKIGYAEIAEAKRLAAIHFGNDYSFNEEGWMHIWKECDGMLPVRIKAVPEGSVIPTGNVLMTIENTDPKCFWLTNALESLLLHVWYPTTVASLSYAVKQDLKVALERTGCSLDGLPFMLHDFGYRSATTDEAAAIGGLGHLVNFLGTDTLPALLLAIDAYAADPNTLAFSVPATEHSVMTADGRSGEMNQVARLLKQNPTGIISCVADSYNIYQFVENLKMFKVDILKRDGKFVVRPDSTTLEHPTPGSLVVDLLGRMERIFGATENEAGFKTLNPKVGMIWGDGIDRKGINLILGEMALHGWAADNLVFGMGGGLLQKVHRDTQRFAVKCSAQRRGERWIDVQKDPLDSGKKSKAGRLKLIKGQGGWATVREMDPMYINDMAFPDQLVLRFENGRIYNSPTFDEVRARAA